MAATATAVVLVGTVGSSAFSSPAYSSRVTRTATAASVSSVSKADLSRIVDADTARRRAANDPGVPGSTPLRMIVDEQREFELALGKAVDTLKKDYPDILKADPDFSIYHDELETIDPSGVKLHGLHQYKTSFRFLHAFVNFFSCPEKNGLTFRLIFDWARSHIRVSWNVELVPRTIYGGVRNTLHVDGISVYEVDRTSGLITQHRIESLMLNDTPVKPVDGIFNALTDEYVKMNPDGIPVLGVDGRDHIFNLEFQQQKCFSNFFTSDRASLFSLYDGLSGDNSSELTADDGFDHKAFQKKNLSRKKFGLKAITQDEFKDIQSQVQKMEVVQEQKAAATANAAEMARQQKKKKNIFEKLLGGVLEDTCEENWDCQRPEVCCDFGFKKMCCSSGLQVYNGVPGQLRLEPVLVDMGNGPMPPDALYN